MTSTELAAVCGVSQRQIYNLKTKFPSEVPASFADVDGWKKFVDAHRVVVAAKRHAPRSNPDVQTDHARYVRARADRTESLAAAERIRLELSRRSVIPRIQVETEFARIAALARGRLLRMLNDLPSALLGLNEADIHRVLFERLNHAMRDLKLSDDF